MIWKHKWTLEKYIKKLGASTRIPTIPQIFRKNWWHRRLCTQSGMDFIRRCQLFQLRVLKQWNISFKMRFHVKHRKIYVTPGLIYPKNYFTNVWMSEIFTWFPLTWDYSDLIDRWPDNQQERKLSTPYFGAHCVR